MWLMVITSINEVAEVMWYLVCLSVCLSMTFVSSISQKLLTDLNQILWNDRTSAKDQSIRFWDWSDPDLDYMVVIGFFYFFNMDRKGVFWY